MSDKVFERSLITVTALVLVWIIWGIVRAVLGVWVPTEPGQLLSVALVGIASVAVWGAVLWGVVGWTSSGIRWAGGKRVLGGILAGIAWVVLYGFVLTTWIIWLPFSGVIGAIVGGVLSARAGYSRGGIFRSVIIGCAAGVLVAWIISLGLSVGIFGGTLGAVTIITLLITGLLFELAAGGLLLRSWGKSYMQKE